MSVIKNGSRRAKCWTSDNSPDIDVLALAAGPYMALLLRLCAVYILNSSKMNTTVASRMTWQKGTFVRGRGNSSHDPYEDFARHLAIVEGKLESSITRQPARK